MNKIADVGNIDYHNKFSLIDKVIIITGACGLIGKAFVEICAQYDAKVVIVDIPLANPEKMALKFSKLYGDRFLGISIDVSKRDDVLSLKNKVLQKYNKIDGLVNCHQNKTAKFFAKFEEYDDQSWNDIISTNLNGTFLTCQIIGSYMANNRVGSIINMPSTYSVVAPNQNLYKGTQMGSPAAYSASKGGVMALSQYLASYWADKGVRVNQLTPHGVWNKHEEKFENNFSNFSPLKRMSYNHEVAPALLYLLSDASSYVTGHNLIVDGGWTMW